ncbi:5-amino-6-(5-phosphoribosylamino)uracil reductase, partial [Streptomyces sp. XM83C]|nr:5-amino-6-(5-phosphoribosylamino)uracil reductase [Streptomyces sp. XM83C]
MCRVVSVARSCVEETVLPSGIRRVVTAWREPDTFVQSADGTGTLTAQGAQVLVLPQYEERAKAPNGHLVG